jgi:deoxyribonuclease (pyrimidine dimer)
MDQHLFAEFREIKMVPKALARSITAYGVVGVSSRIPKVFTLNTGHVCFFYNKGAYLFQRFNDLREELRKRGRNFNEWSELDPNGVYESNSVFLGDYNPTQEALTIIRQRISEKIAMKPNWYRYYGKLKEE